MADARKDRATLERAARWFDEHRASFPHSPYGAVQHAGVDLRLADAGLAAGPTLDDEALLAGLAIDDNSPEWLAAVERILGATVAAGRLDLARTMLQLLPTPGFGAARPLRHASHALITSLAVEADAPGGSAAATQAREAAPDTPARRRPRGGSRVRSGGWRPWAPRPPTSSARRPGSKSGSGSAAEAVGNADRPPGPATIATPRPRWCEAGSPPVDTRGPRRQPSCPQPRPDVPRADRRRKAETAPCSTVSGLPTPHRGVAGAVPGGRRDRARDRLRDRPVRALHRGAVPRVVVPGPHRAPLLKGTRLSGATLTGTGEPAHRAGSGERSGTGG